MSTTLPGSWNLKGNIYPPETTDYQYVNDEELIPCGCKEGIGEQQGKILCVAKCDHRAISKELDEIDPEVQAYVKDTKGEKAFGLFAARHFESREIICELTGKAFLLGADLVDSKSRDFIVDLNPHLGLDTSQQSSLARFVNHSCCSPTCELQPWQCAVTGNERETRLVLVAGSQKISKDTELTVNYYYGRRRPEGAFTCGALCNHLNKRKATGESCEPRSSKRFKTTSASDDKDVNVIDSINGKCGEVQALLQDAAMEDHLLYPFLEGLSAEQHKLLAQQTTLVLRQSPRKLLKVGLPGDRADDIALRLFKLVSEQGPLPSGEKYWVEEYRRECSTMKPQGSAHPLMDLIPYLAARKPVLRRAGVTPSEYNKMQKIVSDRCIWLAIKSRENDEAVKSSVIVVKTKEEVLFGEGAPLPEACGISSDQTAVPISSNQLELSLRGWLEVSPHENPQINSDDLITFIEQHKGEGEYTSGYWRGCIDAIRVLQARDPIAHIRRLTFQLRQSFGPKKMMIGNGQEHKQGWTVTHEAFETFIRDELHPGELSTTALMASLRGIVLRGEHDVFVVCVVDVSNVQLNTITMPTKPQGLIIPIYWENHWAGVFVALQGRHIQYIDSLETLERRHCAMEFVQGLLKFHSHTYGKKPWQEGDKRTQRQSNSYDCGIWVIECARAYLESAEQPTTVKSLTRSHVAEELYNNIVHFTSQTAAGQYRRGQPRKHSVIAAAPGGSPMDPINLAEDDSGILEGNSGPFMGRSLNNTVPEDPDNIPLHDYVRMIKERTLTYEEDHFPRRSPRTVSAAKIEQDKLMTEPFVVPAYCNTWSEDTCSDATGMSWPQDLTVEKVCRMYGDNKTIDVIDVLKQKPVKWKLSRWRKYYQSTEQKRPYNVLSLEVSSSKLGNLIRRPKFVEDLDLQDAVGPGRNPVAIYCIMSNADSWTDFHIDFAGTSVFYKPLKGRKIFFLIDPIPEILLKYTEWCTLETRPWFPTYASTTPTRLAVEEGDTVIIPAGWIHAVWTPEPSLVIGGNFLTRLHHEMQLQVYDIEEITETEPKFKYPEFEKVMESVCKTYINEDPMPIKGLKVGRRQETVAPDLGTMPSSRQSGGQAKRIYSQAERDSVLSLQTYLKKKTIIPKKIAEDFGNWCEWKFGDDRVGSL